jgi:hypothetical protein
MRENEGVGYKRPPKATRFKAGVSGNPSGRPKKTKSLAVELNEELGEVIRVRQGGREIEITKARAVAKELVRLAIGGDLRAATIVLSFSTRSHDESDIETPEATSDDLAVVDSFVEREIRRRAADFKPNLKE